MHTYVILKINERLYSFTTSKGCIYECYFTAYGVYFSDYPAIASKVFGFNLELKYQPPGPTGLDNRIANTVALIIKSFLAEKVNAVVYICDNSDGREKVRFHKFTNWFSKNDDGTIIQLKGVIKVGKKYILNAMLLHVDNKQKNLFIEAYEIISGFYTKPDEDELKELNEEGW